VSLIVSRRMRRGRTVLHRIAGTGVGRAVRKCRTSDQRPLPQLPVRPRFRQPAVDVRTTAVIDVISPKSSCEASKCNCEITIPAGMVEDIPVALAWRAMRKVLTIPSGYGAETSCTRLGAGALHIVRLGGSHGGQCNKPVLSSA